MYFSSRSTRLWTRWKIDSSEVFRRIQSVNQYYLFIRVMSIFINYIVFVSHRHYCFCIVFNFSFWLNLIIISSTSIAFKRNFKFFKLFLNFSSFFRSRVFFFFRLLFFDFILIITFFILIFFIDRKTLFIVISITFEETTTSWVSLTLASSKSKINNVWDCFSRATRSKRNKDSKTLSCFVKWVEREEINKAKLLSKTSTKKTRSAQIKIVKIDLLMRNFSRDFWFDFSKSRRLCECQILHHWRLCDSFIDRASTWLRSRELLRLERDNFLCWRCDERWRDQDIAKKTLSITFWRYFECENEIWRWRWQWQWRWTTNNHVENWSYASNSISQKNTKINISSWRFSIDLWVSLKMFNIHLQITRTC